MNNLEDVVKSVIKEFIESNALFTALDVSNKVKQILPQEKHRTIRDIVRSLFTTHMEPNGWARTPITVHLQNGDTAEALLYHDLNDSWDLDNKYSQQQRSATSTQGTSTLITNLPVVVSIPTTPQAVSTPSTTVQPTAVLSAHDQWASLFQTQPLFQRR